MNLLKYLIAMCAVIATSASIDAQTRVKVTAGEHTLYATFDDNVTSRAFLEKLPLTLPMMDLYGREMCYRFAEALSTDNARTQGYEVGEIVYYPPMHSFVIMYLQNGERFQMQKLGRIESGVEIFNGIGDIEVRFEIDGNSASIDNIDPSGKQDDTPVYDLSGRRLPAPPAKGIYISQGKKFVR